MHSYRGVGRHGSSASKNWQGDVLRAWRAARECVRACDSFPVVSWRASLESHTDSHPSPLSNHAVRVWCTYAHHGRGSVPITTHCNVAKNNTYTAVRSAWLRGHDLPLTAAVGQRRWAWARVADGGLGCVHNLHPVTYFETTVASGHAAHFLKMVPRQRL
jgi:hypothetical protein